jgi:two-component system LytT family response regulator
MHPLKTNPSAQQYLIKPMSPGENRDAIENAERERNSPFHLRRRSTLENHTNPNNAPTRFLIHTKYDTKVIHFDEVIYCVADSNYTNIYLKDGSRLMVCKTLKAVETLLCQSNFLRIHASNLINLNCIKRILKTHGCAVELPNHVVLDVSRSRRNALLKKLENL